MPQMTLAQTRVVDPVLTTAARGYTNASHVGRFLFPAVPVAVRGGKLVEFDKTALKKISTTRAPGAAVKRVQFGHEGKDFAIADHALEAKVPTEEQEEALKVPGIDQAMRSVNGVQELLSLERELEQAEIATTAASYDAANVNTLNGNSQWDNAASDPSKDVAAAVDKIRSATGMRPNVAVIGAKVFDKALKFHGKLLEMKKHVSQDSVSVEDLAQYWGIEKIYIGDAVWFSDDGETANDVWGENMIIAYAAVSTIDRAMPSFGYTYTLNGSPSVEMPYYDHQHRSFMYPTVECYKANVVGKDAGFLIRDILT